MLIVRGLLTAVALAQYASAFFMWFPNYRCVEDHTCSASKRNTGAAFKNRGGEPELRIVQRLPRNGLPHEAQVQRLAERLTQKYARGSRTQPALAAERGLVERTNRYPIVPAAIPTQANSAGIDQDGTDFSYFAKVSLGSQSTPLYMLLDTGAGTSWVMGSSCSSSACKVHNTFNPSDSTTFKAAAQSFSISYGSGAVSGTMGTDDLSLAGLKLPVTFGIANQTSDDFNSFPIDGILGLSQAKSPLPNFLQTLVESKALKANIIGIDISRSSDGPNTGVINFGAVDASRFTGSINYIPVASSTPSDWAIPLDDVGLGDKKAGVNDRLAYIDTGTSYIFGPPGDVAAFHALVEGSKTPDGVTFTVPCTTTTSATVIFGGKTYSISAKDWVGPNVSGTCTSNIYGYAVVEGGWLLGDTFLKNVYAVFDVDQNRIGLATPNGAIDPSTIPSVTSSGGATSLSDSSSIPLSSTGVTATGAPGSASQSSSNAGTTESSSPNGLTTDNSKGSPTRSPGFTGQQSPVSSGTLAAQTSSASPTDASKSLGTKPENGLLTTFVAGFALLIFFS